MCLHNFALDHKFDHGFYVVPMFSNAWIKVLHLGVRDGMLLSQERALRVFNGISFLLIPIPPLVHIMITHGRVEWIPFSSNCLMSLAFIGILISNRFKRYMLAKALYFIVGSWVVIVHVYYFGGKLQLELTFVALFIGAFAFSHVLSEIIFFSLFTIFGYIGCIVLNHFVDPVIDVSGGVWVQIIFSSIIFIVAFASLWMIRSQFEQHEQIIQEHHRQLLEQKEEIEAQHSKITTTNNLLSTKNAALTASINYAQRIQQAILPSMVEIQRHLPDSFIYYKPRDIVSGDFYWHLHFYSKTYFAIADCTGHGVPGAFMSMLGSSMLNLTVQSTFADSPRQILRYLDLQITQMVSRESEESREGMEIILGVYDKGLNTLKISSTNRPFFLFRNGVMEEYKGTKGFIGKSLIEKKPFEEQTFDIKPGDCFYFFTDGITDQFDSLNRKKYSIKRLRHFLNDVHAMDMGLQHKWLEKEMLVWRGDTPQTDDMLLMGLRF